MAEYITIKRRVSLDAPIAPESLPGFTYMTEHQAHEFIISVRKNGEKETITGSVSANVIRPNGTTIFLQGSISDGDAVVRLHRDCYNIPGRLKISIFNTSGGVTTCIYSANYTNDRSTTDNVIDAGDVVPDISDVVAKQEEMTQVIADARTATSAANTAAQNVGNIVARAYSASATYKAGDYCTQNGNLYKAKQDISTAEEWTASHWTQIVMGDEVTGLKSAIENKIQSTANLLDTAHNVPDTFIKQTTGVETPYTGWQSSEYIPINSAEGYCLLIWNSQNWSRPSSVYYAFYNASKVYTHGSFTDATQGFVMQATAGDAYLRVSAQNANMSTSNPMVGKVSDLENLVGDTDIGKYISYGNTLYKDTLKVEFDNHIVENETRLTEIDNNIKSVSIVLPSAVYIAVGRQITFYKPNYIRAKNPDDYVCYWSTSLASTRFNEHIRFEPTTVGTYSATLFIMNRYNGEAVAQKTISIVVVADTARTGKKVLFIGDSLTNAGFYPYEIQKHLSGEGVESIGTVTTTAYLDSDPAVTTRVSVNHEGRGGWSAQDYITKASKGGVVNAFWNPDTSAFDFNYYLTNNGYSLPDVVFVNLGTNGTANPTAEVNAIKTIINSIRARSATVPIVVSAIACGNATQDSYIDIYLTQIREKQIDEFDGKMNGVYVAPIYLNINRMTDWKTETVAESSRNQTEVIRQKDSVHPSKYGYFKFSDVYWSVIQYIMGL